jgi:hypothetical protein
MRDQETRSDEPAVPSQDTSVSITFKHSYKLIPAPVTVDTNAVGQCFASPLSTKDTNGTERGSMFYCTIMPKKRDPLSLRWIPTRCLIGGLVCRDGNVSRPTGFKKFFSSEHDPDGCVRSVDRAQEFTVTMIPGRGSISISYAQVRAYITEH